jgi:hypothetical protein
MALAMTSLRLRAASLGAGVDSTALVLMAAHGEIGPMPDCAFFADTGDEKRATYRHLDWLETVLPFPVYRLRRWPTSLSASTIAQYRGEPDGRPFTPPFFYNGGMLPKQCSKEWKTRAVTGEIRRMLGLAPRERGPKDTAVELWLGISRSEAHRMKPSEVAWIQHRWPLVDAGLRRPDLVRWLVDHGYPVPPPSACVYCPFQSPQQMAEIKEGPDDDWERVVTFDHAIRDGGNGTEGPLFISVERRPIEEVRFDTTGDLFESTSQFGNECEGMCGT